MSRADVQDYEQFGPPGLEVSGTHLDRDATLVRDVDAGDVDMRWRVAA